MTKSLLRAAQQLFCLPRYRGRTDRLSVKAINWWSTTTSYRRLISLQTGSRVWVSLELSNEWVTSRWGGGLETRASPQDIDFRICFVYPRTLHNEVFWLVRNSLHITKVSMKIITKKYTFWCSWWWKWHFWALSFKIFFF